MERQKIRKAAIFISFFLFPLTINYFSPLLIIMGASEGIVNGSFLVFTFLFFAGLFVGRAFCGWACPAGGLQECCFRISDKKARGGRFNWIKYIFIGLPWFAIIIVMVVWSGGYRSVNMFYQMENIISVDQPFGFIGFYVFAGIILILALTAGKRGFYHYVCWITLFMIFGRKIRDIFKWPSLRLKADRDKCIN